jgi:hypothetical protein
MCRQLHVPVLKQSLKGEPRQIGRRKTALLSQSFKLRTLRGRQSKLKSRGVDHAHRRRQSAAGGNAPLHLALPLVPFYCSRPSTPEEKASKNKPDTNDHHHDDSADTLRGHARDTFRGNMPPACVCPRGMAMAKPQRSAIKLLLVLMAGSALTWAAVVAAVHGL